MGWEQRLSSYCLSVAPPWARIWPPASGVTANPLFLMEHRGPITIGRHALIVGLMAEFGGSRYFTWATQKTVYLRLAHIRLLSPEW